MKRRGQKLSHQRHHIQKIGVLVIEHIAVQADQNSDAHHKPDRKRGLATSQEEGLGIETKRADLAKTWDPLLGADFVTNQVSDMKRWVRELADIDRRHGQEKSVRVYDQIHRGYQASAQMVLGILEEELRHALLLKVVVV